MSFPMYYAYKGANPPSRNGASHATIYPYGPFKAGDGKTVMLGLQNEREWAQFCEIVLENPALAQDERFDKNFKRNEKRAELLQIIDVCFSKLTDEQLIARLDNALIANALLIYMAVCGSTSNSKHASALQRWVLLRALSQQCYRQVSMIVITIVWIPFPQLESTPMPFSRKWECHLLKLKRCEPKARFKEVVM